jgi:hypothetical protein
MQNMNLTQARRKTGAILHSLNLLGRFERWLEEKRRNEAEAYLAKAESLYDLEDRMRRLARDMDHPRFMRQV